MPSILICHISDTQPLGPDSYVKGLTAHTQHNTWRAEENEDMGVQRGSTLLKVKFGQTTLRHNLTKLTRGLPAESVALIKSLTTMECKVAHEIRYIAVRLYKASKAIDKQTSKVVSEGPDDIKFFVQRSDNIFRRPYNISTTDLADIEDLYYATCAKVKALLNIVTIYIDEGFRAPNYKYFSYDSPGLRHLAPVELSQFRNMLEMLETALYSERITGPLNEAVLRKNWHLLNRSDKRSDTPDSLPGGLNYAEMIRRGHSMNGLNWSPQIQGLQDLRNKPCGLVFAELTEKYVPIVLKEMIARMENEQRRALTRARGHKTEATDSPAPKVGVATNLQSGVGPAVTFRASCGTGPGPEGAEVLSKRLRNNPTTVVAARAASNNCSTTRWQERAIDLTGHGCYHSPGEGLRGGT